MPLMENLYFTAPVIAQNTLVSAYGYFLRCKRYGRGLSKINDEIAKLKKLRADKIADLQLEQLLQMIRHCFSRVPYYRELFRSKGLSLSDFKNLSDLPKIPFLEKDVLRHSGSLLRAEGSHIYWKQYTSGSMGQPVAVALDEYTYKLSMALLAEHEDTYGIKPCSRRATFAGRMIQRVDKVSPPFWRYNHAERQLLFSTYHISEKTLPAYLEALDQFSPVEIIGYPSAIYLIAEFAHRVGHKFTFTPRAVITNSETLFDWQREAIEAQFGCPVADYYGSAECIVFAAQCRGGRYHVNPLLSIVEVYQGEAPAPPSQAGELVCTTLANKAMPLLRYRLGDTAISSNERCDCGLPYPNLKSIIGRTDDDVITPDGRRIGRLDHIFKGAAGIRECQIIQMQPTQFLLRIVRDPSYRDLDGKTLIMNLRKRVGSDMEVRLEFVEQIERTARGKFRGVVSCCADPYKEQSTSRRLIQ